MKRVLKIFFVIVLILFVFSIIRVSPKRMAFGFFAGECNGNCGTIYEVTNKSISIDTTSFWQMKNDLSRLKVRKQKFMQSNNKEKFDSDKFSIPLIMLFEPRTIFGYPDGYDQGGYYLDFTLFGIKRYFEIAESNEPFYFAGVTKKIDSGINKINSDDAVFK